LYANINGTSCIFCASASMWDYLIHVYIDEVRHEYVAFIFSALSTAPSGSENKKDEVKEENEEPEQENYLWNNIKEFAG